MNDKLVQNVRNKPISGSTKRIKEALGTMTTKMHGKSKNRRLVMVRGQARYNGKPIRCDTCDATQFKLDDYEAYVTNITCKNCNTHYEVQE